MTNHGDDCYFFYYSTCTKGDGCPFRHCEAAMGNETVCNLWQEGRCFRSVCKFRHMEIKKNRKEIACYWENQLAGCQKPHCAFFHEKPRFIDGVYFAPTKGITKNEEQPHEEPAPPPPPAPLPTAANPQLRGVIKAETQETVPSPTHPPVVINPADDDEDEDDQFSEEGEDGKVAPDGSRLTNPRKLPGGPISDESLNFGVSTLEEIRLRKALKASMKRAGYPLQNAETAANGEKENINSFFRPSLRETRDGPVALEETGRLRGSVAERLGKKITSKDARSGGDLPLKRSLAERLGRVVDEEESSLPTQRGLKPVRERLGLPAELVAPTQPEETNMRSEKGPEQIRIKTLEEIRQEKAAKSGSQSPKEGTTVLAPETTISKTISTKAPKGTKRAITIKDSPVVQVKTFSEIIHAKKKKQEEQQNQEKVPSPKKTKQDPVNTQSQPETALRSRAAPTGTEVRVKTLEEIRREKAARNQAQKDTETENGKSPGTEEANTKKPRLLRINKPASLAGRITTQKTAEAPEKPVKAPTAAVEIAPASSNSVKVKTFEEIMREKRLRKQEEEQASSTSQSKSSPEAEPPQKQAAGPSLKRKAPIRANLTPADSSSPSSTTPASDVTASTQKSPVRKLISLKPKAASPVHSTTVTVTTTAAVTAVTSASVKRSSPPRQAEADSLSQSPSSSRESPAPSPTKQARTEPQGPAAQEPAAGRAQTSTQKKSPGQTTDTKVRPKLNVKPSVMKPAAQVKPGQKRKAAERSAVAAVKPLNSATTGPEEQPQESACKQRKILPSSSVEAQLSPAVPSSPGTLLGSGSSPLTEELQTVPVFQESPVQTRPKRETCTVPQSVAPKTPTQSKPRRPSVAASRVAPASSAASSSAVDDFEELMNEFTDDHLEADVDPGIGEDDLLQELSEMIDS